MANITEALYTDLAHVSGDLVRDSRGDVGTISGLANLKNALFHRLMTMPGALTHRPLYGVGVKAYQNAPSSFSVQQRLAARIKEQFELDPRVQEVTGVLITAGDTNPSQFVVAVKVVPKGYTEQEMKFTPFNEGI